MSTFGTQPTFSGSEFYGISTTPYQIAEFVSSWPGGTITAIHVYFGGWTATVNAALCIFDSGGTLLFNTANQVVPQAAGTGAGQQGWVDVTSLVWNLAPNSGIYIGLQRDPAGKFVYSRDGNSTYTKGTNASVGNLTGTTTSTGTLGAYVDYTPAPNISSLSAASGPANSSLTLNGTNFGASQGAGFVTIGGVSASVTSWGDTAVTITVPVLGATATVNVTLTTNNGYTSNAQTFNYLGGGLKVYSTGGAAFVKHPLKVYDNASTSWKIRALKVYDLASTSWKRRA